MSDTLKGAATSVRYAMQLATRQGASRAINQDCVRVVPVTDTAVLAIIADGLGSLANSALASALACDLATEHLTPALASGTLTRRGMAEAMQAINVALWQTSLDRGIALRTTLSVLALQAPVGWIGHVGDCRIYQARDTALTQLTHDHSLAEASSLRRITRFLQGRGVTTRHILDRVVGEHPIVRADVHPVSVAPGDRLILCSDGVWGVLHESGILDTLSGGETIALTLADCLVQAAADQGGQDDASAVVVAVQ